MVAQKEFKVGWMMFCFVFFLNHFLFFTPFFSFPSFFFLFGHPLTLIKPGQALKHGKLGELFCLK